MGDWKPTFPWRVRARVQLLGQRDLGLCLVQHDATRDLFLAETLTEDPPRRLRFGSSSLYLLTELSDEEVSRAVTAAQAARDAARERAEKDRAAHEAAVTRVRAEATNLRLVLDDSGARVLWSGALPPLVVHTVVATEVRKSRGAAVSFERARGVVQAAWLPDGAAALLSQIVRDLGGTVDDSKWTPPVDGEFSDNELDDG